jgi:hypothetical protein
MTKTGEKSRPKSKKSVEKILFEHNDKTVFHARALSHAATHGFDSEDQRPF